MSKVWVCVAGEYSGSHVVAVFSSEEPARRCERALHWGEVIELSLDDTDTSAFPEGAQAYVAYFDWTPGRVEPRRRPYEPQLPPGINYIMPHDEVPTGWRSYSATAGIFFFWAKDLTDAVAVATLKLNEVRGP